MRKILTLLIFACVFQASGQTELKEVVKGNVIDWSISRAISPDRDITFFFYSFQNEKYSRITDKGRILTAEKTQLYAVVLCIREFLKLEKTSIYKEIGTFKVVKYSFTDRIFFEDSDGKYFSLSKEDALTLSNELETNYKLLSE